MSNAGDLGGDQLEGVDRGGAVLGGNGGRGDHDFGDSGDLGGDCCVEDGRGVDGGGSGNVETDSGEGTDELAESAGGEGSGGVLELQFVVAADAIGGVLEGGDELGRDFVPGTGELLLSETISESGAAPSIA